MVLIFGMSALSVLLLERFRIPTLAGFIIAGALIGPHGLGVVEDIRNVETLAEVGVILLLFTVGIEFASANLRMMRRAVLWGGGVQVALAIMLSTVIAYPFAGGLGRAVFAGFLLALSSTAIVLKILLEKGELDTPQGRMMLGVLIFQDICVVPLMLLIPVLSGTAPDLQAAAGKAGRMAVILTAALVGAWWAVPRLLREVVRTRSRELFTVTIIFLCLGIALFTSRLGLSLALGAFLAGIIISRSEYAYQATSEMLPLKAGFLSMFFISVGMLVDVGYMWANFPAVVALVAAIAIVKTVTTTAALLVAGTPLKAALHAGIGLAQVGEFSFVLASAGRAVGLLSGGAYQMFLSASVLTMLLTPLMLRAAPDIAAWAASRRPLKRLGRLRKEAPPEKRTGHVVIVGFGLNGRNLASVLKDAGIPYVVLDLNSETVRAERKKGEAIYFGDGSSEFVLERLGIKDARALVVAISDPISTRRIVALVRKENPGIHIIVRTRYLSEMEELRKLGADEVIPEEFETSVEIFSRVLHHYRLPINVIGGHIDNIRKDGYMMLRTVGLPKRHIEERRELLSGMETETYLVKEDSHLAGHSIRELHLRAKTGATVLAVKRGQEVHQNPSPDFAFHKGDIILLTGKRDEIARAIEYVESDKILTLKYHY